ncbi:MAG TPA: dockerin type I repeat-containing protein, partial [Acetivibrio sp.]|nr:dockerin type I repeat-containing protein [Acetivibrio sp.]
NIHTLTAGTLEVKGDFIQRGRSNSFNSKGDFKVLLSGDKKQAVTFGSIGSVINYLEISNESEEGVTFEGCFPIAKLYESIEINGNVYLGRNLDLNGYKLTVKGNLYHTDGTLIINSGTLEVEGDYIIGTIEGGTVDSILSMSNSRDYVKVHGDFVSNTSSFHNLKAGTLEVKGDFIHKGRYNGFNQSKDHKVLLSGSGIQTVSFTDDRYGFNTLVITKPIEEGYIFANEGKVWKNLEETDSDDEPYTPVDTTPILINGDIKLSEDTEYFKDLILLDGSLDLNGYTLVVNGDFKQYSGNVYINGGKLIIKRNYMIQDFAGGMAKASLEMRNTDDYVEVFGNFVMNSSVDHSTLLIAGTLEIKGDLVQIYDDYSSGGAKRSFNASRDHNVILSGEGKQEVVFGSPLESKINNLIIKNSSEEGIIFRSGLPVEKLNEDVCIKGDLLIIRNLDLNGYALKVQGNLRQIGGTLSINGGYLEVEGDYLIESPEGGMVNAILDMRNEKDRVKILGDFVMHSAKNHFGYLNAGIMEISGDFTQRNEGTSQSKRNFSASENHRVLLNGEGIQTVVFRYPGESSFNELEITKPLETGYVFRNDLPVWKKLIESGQSIIYGDLNEDGDVDSLDLTILKRYLLRKIDKLPCQNGHIAADLNGNGDVDSLDLMILKRYLLRKIDKFPVSE